MRCQVKPLTAAGREAVRVSAACPPQKGAEIGESELQVYEHHRCNSVTPCGHETLRWRLLACCSVPTRDEQFLERKEKLVLTGTIFTIFSATKYIPL
ncbi:hypothetical protein AVEN_187685-1 [Araneus ventricosus]|uniref:Uncharacterized protein n=1 Tax=Araneus ventricosus TaxID=182803 RepID=A0A4Y2URI5_ARAVE|nr:hypothetical protein AVEN_187685-1 [Araneus ventricosus]